ncbi:MAG: metallophosphoesterase [Myxococcales bacterium]|nr:metallophosphoesterase [Myxococcales bacterium]
MRRFFAVGDPQAELSKLLAVLGHHGLLDANEQLRPEVGLVSMGDHFDFGAPRDEAHRIAIGLEGERILEWLSAHPEDQVRILVGNHDLARVQELAPFDDASFGAAREAAAAIAAMPEAEREDATAAFHECFAPLPTPGVATRDFSAFAASQRPLVQRLLVSGRFEAAIEAEIGGRACLLNHTGVTTRELRLLEVAGSGEGPSDPSVADVAGALNDFFRARVAEAGAKWALDEHALLDLAPLYHMGVPGQEAGGWLAARPANRDRASDEDLAWSEARPRRYDPRALAPGLLQAVGHTQHKKLLSELAPWTSEAAHASTYELRSLVVRGGNVRYRAGVDVSASDATVIFTDVRLLEAPPDEAALLPLDAVRPR